MAAKQRLLILVTESITVIQDRSLLVNQVSDTIQKYVITSSSNSKGE